jgi:hypothetical protein
MKCSKCGFVSFDFLSECKKCGTNIAGSREALGFDTMKPSVPFFLGALLKDYETSAPGAEAARNEDTISSFDFGEESDSRNGDFKLEGEAAVQPRENEDFSLLDLTDEELDLLIADGEADKGGAQNAAASEQTAASPAAPEPASPKAAAPEDANGKDLHIELTEQDLEMLLSELGDTSQKNDRKD